MHRDRTCGKSRHIVPAENNVRFFIRYHLLADGSTAACLLRMLEKKENIAAAAMAVNFRRKCAKRGAVTVVSAFMRNAAVFGSIGERGVILDRKRVKIRTKCNSACRDGLRSGIQRSLVHGIEPCTHIMQLKRSVRAEKINEHCFCLFFLPGKLRAAVKPMTKYDGSFKNIFIHCGNTSMLNNICRKQKIRFGNGT